MTRHRQLAPKLKLALARIQAEVSGLSEEAQQDVEECKSLGTFIARAWHTIEPGTEFLSNWHIDCICEHLEAVSAGQIRRLLINIPPRYMKSIACSVMWPIWEWTTRPDLRYMFATYAATLSEDHAESRRAVIASDWFKERWGHVFKITKDQISTYRNDHRGVFEATSFTGTATGKGANRLVVDDPHNPKKAESDTERASGVRLFKTTFTNRLNDKFKDAIVVVMQRLHQEDISAVCMEQEYVHLCLEAVAEAKKTIVFPMSGRTVEREVGDLLWPTREGPDQIAEQQAQGSYYFAGQYQQRPAPAGGGMFKSFEIVDALPVLTTVRGWDKAGSEGKGDFSAGVKIGVDGRGVFYIADVTKGQWSAGAREKVIRDTATLDGFNTHIWIEQEPGSGGKDSAEITIKNLAGFVAQKQTASGEGSKIARARPLAAQAEIGNVKLLRGPWNKDFIDEAQIFPNGRHDDQIDAASLAFAKLVLMPRPTAGLADPPIVPTEVPRAGAHRRVTPFPAKIVKIPNSI